MKQATKQCPKCWKGLQSQNQQEATNFCPHCQFPLKLIADKYKLEAQIGAGAFGTVYLGRQDEESQAKAIKVMRWDTASTRAPDSWNTSQKQKKQQEFEKRFEREVNLTSALARKSWHIVQIDEAGSDEIMGLYYVMEHLEGAPLRQLMVHWPCLARKLTFSIMEQLCQGVSVAHRDNIIHRDLKPENIYLLKQEDLGRFVKILDFGLAKWLDQGGKNLTSQPMGTPLYMPPEQCLNEETDQRTDIYAMAAVMFQLLTGKALYENAKDTSQMLYYQIQAAPPSICERMPELGFPLGLDKVIQKALAKKKEERYETVDAFWSALLPFVHWEAERQLTQIELRPATQLPQTLPYAPNVKIAYTEDPCTPENSKLSNGYTIDEKRWPSPSSTISEAQAKPKTKDNLYPNDAPSPSFAFSIEEPEEWDSSYHSRHAKRWNAPWKKPTFALVLFVLLCVGAYTLPQSNPMSLATLSSHPTVTKPTVIPTKQAPKPRKKAPSTPQKIKKTKRKSSKSRKKTKKRRHRKVRRRKRTNRTKRRSNTRQLSAWVSPISFKGIPNWPGAQRARIPSNTSNSKLTRHFWMWRTEVTQGQFQALMGYNPAKFKSCGKRCPVENVSWHEAAAFANQMSLKKGLPQCFQCTGKGKQSWCTIKSEYSGKRYYQCKGWRLPTEAEWEHAYHAGSQAPFTTGACLSSEQANFNGRNPGAGCKKGRKRGRTLAVGRFRANKWGLYDMTGNVWEWTYDGQQPHAANNGKDPISPARTRRVVKGGGWYSPAAECKAKARESFVSTQRSLILGFRPVRTK